MPATLYDSAIRRSTYILAANHPRCRPPVSWLILSQRPGQDAGGAKFWQNGSFPKYGRLYRYRSKDITYQVEIMLQQDYLQLDGYSRLITITFSGGRERKGPVCILRIAIKQDYK